MPLFARRVVKIDQFVPKTYWAVNDPAGGEGQYVDETYRWCDNLIVSLGCDEVFPVGLLIVRLEIDTEKLEEFFMNS